MSDDRRERLRRRDDNSLPALRQALERHQFATERRHVDNTQRLDAIDSRLDQGAQRLDNIDNKLAELDGRMQTLHDCVDRNALLIEGKVGQLHTTIADMKDNFLPLLIKDAGKKTWRLATVGRKCVQWLSPIIVFILMVWAYVLWVLGKGPFPHP